MTELHIFFKTLALLLIAPAVLAVDVELPTESENAYRDSSIVELLAPPDASPLSTGSHGLELKQGKALRQRFRATAPHPLLEKSVKLHHLVFSLSGFPGQTHDIELSIFRDAQDGKGKPLHQQRLKSWREDYQFIDPETGIEPPKVARFLPRLIPLTGPLDLTFGGQYVVELTVLRSTPFRMLSAAQAGVGESASWHGALWFMGSGEVRMRTTGVTISAAAGNRFAFDTSSAGLPKKLLGIGATPETLYVARNAGDASYRYELADNTVATLDVSRDNSGQPDAIRLAARKAGQTRLSVYRGTDIVAELELHCFSAKQIRVSYHYVPYPMESEHPLRHAAADVSRTIRDLYAPYNVEVTVVDRGEIAFEWDLNGDGKSYDAKRIERAAVHGIIPNPKAYFSNLIVFRQNKNDAYHGGSNGGGTSHGFGSADSSPRYASISVHLKRTPESIGSTLGHELAHNMGLSHCSSANANRIPVMNDHRNLMKTGRRADEIFAFQWAILHRNLQEMGCAAQETSK